MKAWIVSIPDEWGSLVHADSRGKAIAEVRAHVSNWNDFIDFRAKRIPGLDDIPITWKAAAEAGFEYVNDDGTEFDEIQFTNDCYCHVCRPVKND